MPVENVFRRTWKRWGLTGRLTGWFLLISMLPVALLLTVNQKLTESTIRQDELAHLNQLADFKTHQIEAYLTAQQKSLSLQAQSVTLGQAMQDFRKALDSGDSSAQAETERRYRPQLAQVVRLAGYEDLLMFTPDGRLLFSQSNRFAAASRRDQPPLAGSYLAKALEDTVSSFQSHVTPLDYHLSDSDAPLFVVVPVIHNGVLLGAVAAKIAQQPLVQIVTDPGGLSNSGIILLAQPWRDDIRLVTPARDMDRIIDRPFQPLKGDPKLPIRNAVFGNSGSGEAHDFRGVEVLAAWRFMPEQSWGLVIKSDESEAMSLVDRQRSLMIFTALITLAAVIALALYASKSLTRPIRELTEVVRGMSTGNLQSIAAVDSDDELGELGLAFNTMTADLRNVYKTIEDEVFRRTVQLENSNHALEQTRDELRKFFQVVESGPVSVIITNAEGVVEYVNPRFSEITGYPLDEMVGSHPPQNLIPRELSEGGQVWADLRQGSEWRSEYPTRRRNGEEFWVATSISPVRLAGGRLTHFVAILEDVSSRKQTEEQLLAAKDSAENANRAKSEFLAVMSHEIRTPMNGILGMTQLMLDTPLSAQQRDYLDTIHHSSEALLGLLNDILDLSKLEAGRVELEMVNFSLSETLHSVIDLMTPKAAEKRLPLSSHVTSPLPDLLHGDPSRLRQILLNLVGNAIKFTDKGEITVIIDVLPASELDRIDIRFTVSDTGIGILPETKARLFQSFSQGDTSISRRYGGSGLGLTISRRLVEIQGGSIGVDSEPGQGSRFWFTLSYRPAEVEQPKRGRSKLNQALPRLSVLLAEDNSVNRKVAAALLQKWGHMVTAVADGQEAVEAVQAGIFDVVLMDVQMPGMDGLEATKAIRAMEGPGDHLPIIALTANAMPADQQRCLDVGMDDYVSKPIDHERLYTALERVCVKRMEARV